MQQAIVVAMVQPDRRLVQNIQHAAQLGTNLRCQADALTFAAAQRGSRTAKSEM